MTTEPGSAAAPPAAVFSSSHWGRRMAILSVPVALDATVRLLHPDLHTTTYYYAGIMVLLIAWAIALTGRSGGVRRWTGWMIPILVLGSIGLLRVVPEQTGMGIMVVFPALWLGVDKRLPGVAVASVSVLVLQALPGLVYLGGTASTWVASVQLCLVATICALSQSWIADGWRSHESQLHERQVRLGETMRRLSAGQALNEAIMNAVDVGLVGLRSDGSYAAMNEYHRGFLELAFPDGHRGYAGQLGWVFEEEGITLLTRDQMPTYRAQRGEEFSDCLIWVGKDPATRRALAVSARQVGGDGEVAAVLVDKDVTDLVQALRARDEFVATVSHELRTPLTSILGYLDLAVTDVPERDPRRGYLEVVQRNARRLLRLVNDLLLTAQTAQGVLDLDRRPIDLSVVVGVCADDLRGRAVSAEVDVETDLQPGTWVHGDHERLAEVIDNLITNAIKYSHAGGSVRVRLVTTDVRDGAPPEVVLTVGDDGIGISESDRSQLFTKFFRTQEAQRRAIQGVGLGLSISRSIISAHDGSIEVHSEQGVGTTFVVRLPLATRPTTDDRSGTPGDRGAAESRPRHAARHRAPRVR